MRQSSIAAPRPLISRSMTIDTGKKAWIPATLHAPVVPLPRATLPTDTVTLAQFLLGKVVVREWEGAQLMGRIVESEAYLATDPACHAFRGMTPRNRSLFLEAGHAYVYLCYGVSYLLNVSSETYGVGSGVLLRALEPLAGVAHMQKARNGGRLRDLGRGPGRLAAALRVDRRHDGIDLLDARGPLWLGTDGTRVDAIGVSTRIGLTKGADAMLRFFVANSGHLSGPRLLNLVQPVSAPP
jgi:DNA-3-methyladenine glycosylase